MKISAEETVDGIKIVMGNKKAFVRYPPKIWQGFPLGIKKCLIDNLTYARTMAIATIDGHDKIEYQTGFPLLKSFFDECHVRDIPRITKWDYRKKTLKTSGLLKKFMNSESVFSDSKQYHPTYNAKISESVIVPFSFGKDSLLTYALAEELELKPQAVFIKDMFDAEAGIKKKQLRAFEKEFNKVEILHDEGDKLFWGRTSQFNPVVTNALNCYSLMLLPFAHHYKSGHIIFGNQQNMNGSFPDDEGFKTYASYEQSSEWTNQQDAFIKILTAGKIGVFSLIEPIHNIVAMHILYHRYPQYAKYQHSCSLENCRTQKIWCQNCSKCAHLFAISKALHLDVKAMGFTKNMFNKEYAEFYAFLKGKKLDAEEIQYNNTEEELLSLYMAYRKGARGYVIEKFKRKCLEDVSRRERELKKKYLTITVPQTIPEKIRSRVVSLYKDEIAHIL